MIAEAPIYFGPDIKEMISLLSTNSPVMAGTMIMNSYLMIAFR